MKMTSAMANKMLRKLKEEKTILLAKEQRNKTYKAYQGEAPIVPEYDFENVSSKLVEIDRKVLKIKHALNIFNCTTKVPETGKTIDEVLVYMAMLEQQKSRLNTMKDKEKVSRIEAFGNRNNVAEYEYANFNIELVQARYEETVELITSLQLQLDVVNQTITFDVDI